MLSSVRHMTLKRKTNADKNKNFNKTLSQNGSQAVKNLEHHKELWKNLIQFSSKPVGATINATIQTENKIL